KSAKFGHHAQIITAGRAINDNMGAYVAKQLVQKLIYLNKNPKQSRVLIMGITFKENVSDIRNSKVVDVVHELNDFGLNVDVVDPHADPQGVKDEYGLDLSPTINPGYDAIVIAVGHDEYKNLNERYFMEITRDDAVLVDLKGIFRNQISKMIYWSL
ncbi:MAG TPA: UDP binding domain-containing protein, partial [Bacteroidales bacterium]|nr:UDP binding domain-containing protein [Bacteroidales bacterium]